MCDRYTKDKKMDGAYTWDIRNLRLLLVRRNSRIWKIYLGWSQIWNREREWLVNVKLKLIFGLWKVNSSDWSKIIILKSYWSLSEIFSQIQNSLDSNGGIDEIPFKDLKCKWIATNKGKSWPLIGWHFLDFDWSIHF